MLQADSEGQARAAPCLRGPLNICDEQLEFWIHKGIPYTKEMA